MLTFSALVLCRKVLGHMISVQCWTGHRVYWAVAWWADVKRLNNIERDSGTESHELPPSTLAPHRQTSPVSITLNIWINNICVLFKVLTVLTDSLKSFHFA